VNHQKFYFFDVGLYNTIRPHGPLDSPEEKAGPHRLSVPFSIDPISSLEKQGSSIILDNP